MFQVQLFLNFDDSIFLRNLLQHFGKLIHIGPQNLVVQIKIFIYILIGNM